MLVMVVAMLAMLALLATTFLVSARYDRVSVASSQVGHQMEMLLSMAESAIRRELAEDLWGDNCACNNPGDPAHEGYDAPDAKHPWMTGICGRQIGWEAPAGGGPDYMQYVLSGENGWTDLPGEDTEEVSYRYCGLLQGLGGLMNVNVARRSDPDLVAGGSPADSNGADPASWPYTIWAFHAGGGYSFVFGGRTISYPQRPDWGYWWYTATQRNAFGLKDLYGGLGQPIRGGGPLANVELRSMLASPGELAGAEAWLRDEDNYGRFFDLQDELDLRFPGEGLAGSPCTSRLEAELPSLFAAGRPQWEGRQIPAGRRRLVTAVARTTNWQRRREPVLMQPYPDSFWNAQPGVNRNWCKQEWYWTFDYPHFDDLIKYYNEAVMGYRISLQHGVMLTRMWPDDKYYIYDRLMTHYGHDAFRPLVGVADFPGRRGEQIDKAGNSEWVRSWAPYQYTDWTVDWEHRDVFPVKTGDLVWDQGTTMVTLLLANTMAQAGVPDPSKDPDDASSYTPAAYAHLPVEKESRIRAYRKFVGTMHLNLEDYQDANTIPAVLRGEDDEHSRMRYERYGDRTGAEGRVYLTEAVMEFELWPDYAIIWEKDYYGKLSLEIYRVDAGTSAANRGLPGYSYHQDPATGDITEVTVVLTHARRTPADPATPWSDATDQVKTLANLRARFGGLRPGDTIDAKGTRQTVVKNGSNTISNTTEAFETTRIELSAAVKTIAVEVYNPNDYEVLVDNSGDSDSFYSSPRFRYNVAVPQQNEYRDGAGAWRTERDFILHTPNGYCPVRALPAKGSMLFVDFRGVTNSTGATLGAQYGIGGAPTYQAWGHRARYVTIPCEHGNLTNLRADGDLILGAQQFTGNWVNYAYLCDVVRNQATWPAPPPTPATSAVLPDPKGIRDAFAFATTALQQGKANPAVRLYRPRGMESRATQFMSTADSWAPGQNPSVWSRLGRRDADEEDFALPAGSDYWQVDGRGYIVTASNKAFRFGADLSRVTRLTQPKLRRQPDSYTSDAWRQQHMCTYDGAAGDPERIAPTEVVDREIRKALADIAGLPGEKTMASVAVRQRLQKFEARLRYSPYSPMAGDPAEVAECAAWYDFLDAFTVGGAAYDNIDNNGNSVADEHGTYDYDLGLPPELAAVDAGGWWLKEHSNCWPAYGRINLNTAPREVLDAALMAPDADTRHALAAAIWTERGGEAGLANADYKPFTSLGNLYRRVSVLNGYDGGGGRGIGFDYFGFDGKDNHNGAARLPDMTGWNPDNGQTTSLDPAGCVDDLDERNYLWRLNGELVTLRTDTFAAYLRFQARRKIGGQWKILAERRVYSLWDRANCIWPPRRQDDKMHPDFVPPQRLGVQIFSY